MNAPTLSGPRVVKLRELDTDAYIAGSAEGRVPGIGVVQIDRLEPTGRRVGRFERHYRLEGEKTTAAALYRRARALDEAELAEIRRLAAQS
jgi:hypothetical protein